ncbi:MAG: FAD-dependent oxidoreductase [Acidobacteria bacterium]|nr:FAD-dependent oxidoreductase [Acidobacteriota bacterium]MBI3487395.1 FAD-dependent oxidoreductase [Acidobacteriota bacterium]
MSPSLRILVVGGVAGGASAAARARRLSEEADIVLFERGSYVSFANCGLPYHIGGVIPERGRLLVQTPESLNARFDIDVRIRTEVVSIDPQKQVVVARDLDSGRESVEAYDALVLSPGAEAIRPALPGFQDEKVLTLRNMGDMDRILAAIPPGGGGRALVVGGGFIGLELAEQLRHRGMAVAMVEKLPHVLGVADPEMTFPLQEELGRQGVDLRLGRSVTAFEREGESLLARLDDGDCLSCDVAVMSVGVRPEARLAREAGLAIGPTGGIRVDDQMRTSHPNIYAVGDAVEVRDFVSQDPALIPLAGPANRQGRIAAEVILGRASRYKATQGTSICKVFDLTFAMTGLSEAALRRKAMPYQRIYVHPADHATYYPGAQPISLKLLFAPGDGRVLGAQAVGVAGVDKRIDVIAMAQRGGLTVFDLEDAELCYAPPYGSAKDAVNMAGFVASNVLRGDVALWEPEELAALDGNQMLLDVRTFQEHAGGSIPGAVCAPVDELRDRIEDLPMEKELLVFCQVGLRGYVAARLLAQRGFRVRNLSGGYRRYAMWKGTHAVPLACETPARSEDGK